MQNLEAGKRIKCLREARNYTREELAEKADISAKFLYEIEVGKKGFSADTLSRIANALSVSCDFIMFGTDSPDKNLDNAVGVLNKFDSNQMERILNILEMIYDLKN